MSIAMRTRAIWRAVSPVVSVLFGSRDVNSRLGSARARALQSGSARCAHGSGTAAVFTVGELQALESRQLLTTVSLSGSDPSHPDDAWYIRLKPSVTPEVVQIFSGDSAAGILLNEVARDSLQMLQIDGGTGNDRLTIDFSDPEGRKTLLDGVLLFNGGSGTDTVHAVGDGLIRLAYEPHSNSFDLSLAQKITSHVGVEQITARDFDSVKLVTPSVNDVLTVDSPSAQANIITGTAGASASRRSPLPTARASCWTLPPTTAPEVPPTRSPSWRMGSS